MERRMKEKTRLCLLKHPILVVHKEPLALGAGIWQLPPPPKEEEAPAGELQRSFEVMRIALLRASKHLPLVGFGLDPHSNTVPPLLWRGREELRLLQSFISLHCFDFYRHIESC